MFISFPYRTIYNPIGLSLNKMQLNAKDSTEIYKRKLRTSSQPGHSKLSLDDNHSLGDNESKEVTQIGSSVRRIRQAYDGVTY